MEPYGRVHDFCGRTHADEYRKKYGSYYSVGKKQSWYQNVYSIYVCVIRNCVGDTPQPVSGFKHSPAYSSKGKTSSSSQQPVKAVHGLSAHSHINPYSKGSSREIKFYNRDEPFYEFTNFHPCSVYIDGKMWPTTEHYFQAQKFIGTPYVDRVRRLHHPREAFQLSRDPKVSRWRRSDWESVKDDVMLKALRAKFSDQNPKLLSLLLSTGDKKLIEHTSNDSYWGDGGDGTGSNKLGQLLMRVRSELRAKRGASVVPAVGWSQDDSALSRMRERSISPSPSGGSLRRSGSFSTPRSTPSQYGYGRGTEMVTGRVSSPRQPSYPPSHPKGGNTPHHGGKGHNTQSSIIDPLKKQLKTAKSAAKSTVSYAASVVQGGSSSPGTKQKSQAYKRQSQGTSTGSRSSRPSHVNTSSVPYNIINHSKYK